MEMPHVILGFIFLGWAAIIFSIIYSIKKTKSSLLIINKDLAEVKSNIICVASDNIPGKEVRQVIGIVRGISKTQAKSKDQFELGEKEAMYNMILEARSLGANAIVGISLNSGTYQQTGSKWQVSQLVYTGTAVII